MKTFAVALFVASAAARHHSHRPIGVRFIEQHEEDMESLESKTDSELVTNLQAELQAALKAEAKDDKAAAIAKTAAIKNIQKALTARILKRLDDGQPLVEVARKMKAIEGMQPQINDMERRLGIMQSVEPVLENAIKTLQKVVDVRGMGKKAFIQVDDETVLVQWNDPKEDPYPNPYATDPKTCYDGKGSYLRPGSLYPKKEEFEEKRKCTDACEYTKNKEKEAKEKAEEAEVKEKQLEIIEHKKEMDKIIKKQEEAEEKVQA